MLGIFFACEGDLLSYNKSTSHAMFCRKSWKMQTSSKKACIDTINQSSHVLLQTCDCGIEKSRACLMIYCSMSNMLSMIKGTKYLHETGCWVSPENTRKLWKNNYKHQRWSLLPVQSDPFILCFQYFAKVTSANETDHAQYPHRKNICFWRNIW